MYWTARLPKADPSDEGITRSSGRHLGQYFTMEVFVPIGLGANCSGDGEQQHSYQGQLLKLCNDGLHLRPG